METNEQHAQPFKHAATMLLQAFVAFVLEVAHGAHRAFRALAHRQTWASVVYYAVCIPYYVGCFFSGLVLISVGGGAIFEFPRDILVYIFDHMDPTMIISSTFAAILAAVLISIGKFIADTPFPRWPGSFHVLVEPVVILGGACWWVCLSWWNGVDTAVRGYFMWQHNKLDSISRILLFGRDRPKFPWASLDDYFNRTNSQKRSVQAQESDSGLDGQRPQQATLEAKASCDKPARTTRNSMIDPQDIAAVANKLTFRVNEEVIKLALAETEGCCNMAAGFVAFAKLVEDRVNDDQAWETSEDSSC